MVENEDEEDSDPGGREDSPFSEDGLFPAERSGRCSAPTADEDELCRLIARVVEQDQQALASIYDQLSGKVYHLALRITRLAQLAEEVVEDTFWQVWRQAPRFEPQRGSALAWIMTIARSRALDAQRAARPARCESGMDELAEFEANLPDLLDWVASLQEGHRLRLALASLDALPLQLVALAFFRGMSHDEIAEFVSLPLGTVKSQIRRALLRLRQILSTDDTYH